MWQGFVYGLLSSCSFGLIPLFTLPLMAQGMNTGSILACRFGISALVMGLLLAIRREPLVIAGADALRLGALSFFYAAAAVTFFFAFRCLDSGLVATLQFSYPVYVVLIMICFLHEKARLSTFAAMFMAMAGVALLSLHDGGTGRFSLLGIGVALFSAVLNALYVVGIQAVRLRVSSGLSITFYLMLFGSLYSLLYAVWDASLTLPRGWAQWGELLLLGVITGVVSNLTLVAAIRRIGSTLASVLGAMEPVTAVSVGVLVFHEPFTLRSAAGSTLIIGAVMLIMLAPHLRRGEA